MDVPSERKDLLRFITCGSVDDGKSTLIGRILFDMGQVHDDQLIALKRDSRLHDRFSDGLDLSLLVDGLEAEREQGITIDVAYRYFSTPVRSFIVADTPGHEQYTRNMATGASGAELAVILVDARKGVLPQTQRHATICSLMGVRHVVLAVNKIDLVDFDASVFEGIAEQFALFAKKLGFRTITAIPISARLGDNVLHPSTNMVRYSGPTLLQYLERIDVGRDLTARPFRMAVQLVVRLGPETRGLAGTIATGTVQRGAQIAVAVSGMESKIKNILGPKGEVEAAQAGDAVILTLEDEIDISRGDVLVAPQDRPIIADQFTAHLVWMVKEPLFPGRRYLMRIGTRWVSASVTQLKYRINVENGEHQAARQLELNEIGVANLTVDALVAFDLFTDNRATGAFILVDRYTNATAAAGMIQLPLRRATNVHPEPLLVDQNARSALKGHRAVCVWFTGLSGSGKSTLAKVLEQRLNGLGRHTMLLDGDNLRHGLNRDLGFTDADRVENIRRAGEVARLMTEAGLIVICSFISPFHAEREMIRAKFPKECFVEVFVDTPLVECIRRDPKGLYAKAREGQIPNLTGIGSSYEKPQHPEIHLSFEPALQDQGNTKESMIEKQVDQILALMVP